MVKTGLVVLVDARCMTRTKTKCNNHLSDLSDLNYFEAKGRRALRLLHLTLRSRPLPKIESLNMLFSILGFGFTLCMDVDSNNYTF